MTRWLPDRRGFRWFHLFLEVDCLGSALIIRRSRSSNGNYVLWEGGPRTTIGTSSRALCPFSTSCTALPSPLPSLVSFFSRVSFFIHSSCQSHQKATISRLWKAFTGRALGYQCEKDGVKYTGYRVRGISGNPARPYKNLL